MVRGKEEKKKKREILQQSSQDGVRLIISRPSPAQTYMRMSIKMDEVNLLSTRSGTWNTVEGPGLLDKVL